MKLTKILGVAAFAAMALMAFASTASATTLETNGVKQTGTVTLKGTLEPETSALLTDTSGAFANTCTSSTVEGSDSTATTGTTVSGPITALSFSNCTDETVVVDEKGSLSVEWIKGTTNGTLRSTGAKVTVPATLFGFKVTVTCVTEKTDLGTITGKASGSATIDINAVLNCGSSLPSAPWKGSYVTTTSSGGAHAIGVVE